MAEAEVQVVMQYNYQQFADYLQRKEMRREIVELFEENLIDGEVFFDLSEEDMKELVPIEKADKGTVQLI